jgi:tRNA-splicing ligase RtcB
MISNVTIFAPEGQESDEKVLAQLAMCMADERAVSGALMADHHLGYSMPIGGVVAYDGAISPSGVGFDIACGNKAVLTPLLVEDVVGTERWRLLSGTGQSPSALASRDEARAGSTSPSGVPAQGPRTRSQSKNEASLHAYSAFRSDDVLGKIMEEIERTVAFGLGRSNAQPIDHDLFDAHAATLAELDRLADTRHGVLSAKARAQLGTVGSGNHYVDLLTDEQDRVWVANHFGSRGLGHTIATGFLNLGAGLSFGERTAEKEEPTVIPTDSYLGQFYLDAMRLAGDYAYAGRDFVIDQVLGLLGTTAVESVHVHHNFAWLEDGLWVVRKGATPLTTEPAYIGGSMGDGAVIVRGTGADIGNLASAPHGAGRVMSRTKAAGKFKKVTVERIAPDGSTYPKKIRVRDASTAAVDWEAVKVGLDARGIVVRGSGADEAPEVYKSLDAVLAAHSNIEVVHRLRPLGVVMAGADTFDPYKD